jgi:hypothetical protein
VTLIRVYRNGDVWKESTHFGRDDLLLAAKVLDLARIAHRIFCLQSARDLGRQ